MKKWRLLIKNICTGKSKWYSCPLNKDKIYKELKIDSRFDYNIKESHAPYNSLFCYKIEDVIDEYNAYIKLPDFLQKHIYVITRSLEFDSIAELLNHYNEGLIKFYPGLKTKEECIIQYIQDNKLLPDSKLKECSNYRAYIEELAKDKIYVNMYVVNDGVIVIER